MGKRKLDEITLASMYASGASIATCATEFGVTPAGVRVALKRLGVREPEPMKQTSREDADAVVALYAAGHAIETAASMVGITYSRARRSVLDAGLCRSLSAARINMAKNSAADVFARLVDHYRFSAKAPEHQEPAQMTGGWHNRFPLDEGYFDSIDTEVKAYLVGWLVTDGCVKTGNERIKRQPRIALCVHPGDAYIVKLFRASVRSASAITTSKRAKSPYVSIAVSSEHMAKSLANIGIHPRKSLVAQTPPVPVHLRAHMWRGIVDGDGWIASTGIGVCGSKGICDGFKSFVFDLFGVELRVRQNRTVWMAELYSKTYCAALLDVLYHNATVLLPRKAAIGLKIMREIGHPNAEMRAAEVNRLAQQHSPPQQSS